MNPQPKSLQDLLDQIRAGQWDDYEWSDMPTFGGDMPEETIECWSWDADSVLVGVGRDILILPRSDWDAKH